MTLESLSYVFTLENQNLIVTKNLATNVYSRSIHNIPQTGDNPKSETGKWTNKL